MSTSAHAGQENRAVLERREGSVATLILNRPERMNALNADLVLALNDALKRVDAEQDVAVVVLAGAGRAFCAGGDLTVIGKGRQENNITEPDPILRAGRRAVVENCHLPPALVCAVAPGASGAG